jgi:hypothetical protein
MFAHEKSYALGRDGALLVMAQGGVISFITCYDQNLCMPELRLAVIVAFLVCFVTRLASEVK